MNYKCEICDKKCSGFYSCKKSYGITTGGRAIKTEYIHFCSIKCVNEDKKKYVRKILPDMLSKVYTTIGKLKQMYAKYLFSLQTEKISLDTKNPIIIIKATNSVIQYLKLQITLLEKRSKPTQEFLLLTHKTNKLLGEALEDFHDIQEISDLLCGYIRFIDGVVFENF